MTTLSSPVPKLRSYWRHLSQNPVTVKELRSRMRGRRAFAVLTGNLFVMAGFVGLVYHSFYVANSSGYGPSVTAAGKSVLATIVIIQVFIVVFGSMSFTNAAIIGEKERQTYDLLRTTSLTAEQLIMGKLLSALSYVLLIAFTSIPLESIAFFLGGVSLSEIVISQLLLVASAVTFALIGLYASAVARSVQVANTLAFSGAALLLFGLPTIAGLLGVIFQDWFETFPGFVQAYLMMLIVFTNLPGTMIVSEAILLNEGSLWAYKVYDSPDFWLISPWTIHLLFNVLFSLFIYRRTVRRVQLIPDR